VLGIMRVKIYMSDGSVGVLDEPARDKAVQTIRNRPEGNRLVSRRLVNFLNLGKDETERHLRLRIRAREL